jgi:hypothetical protein
MVNKFLTVSDVIHHDEGFAAENADAAEDYEWLKSKLEALAGSGKTWGDF